MFDGGEIPVFAAAASFTVIAVLLFLRRFKQNAVKDDGKRYPPSLPILPAFGAIIRGGMTAVPEHFMRSAETLGPVFSCAFGKRLVVVLNGYEAIFDALAKHSEAFADRSGLFIEKNIMNHELRGLAHTHYDDRYKRYHKISLSIFKEFGFGVKSSSETRILQEVEKMNEEIMKHNGRPLYPKWIFAFASSNVVLNILLGKSFLRSLPKVHSNIVRCSGEIFDNFDISLNMVPIVRFLPMFWKKINSLGKYGQELLRAIDVGIEYVKSHDSEPTFVGRFLEIEGVNYDGQDIRYIVRDLIFGSTDTVSTTILWAMVILANHPDIQRRFQKEIDEVVPVDRLPSLDDKPYLPYTEAVILEVMRRQTLTPFFIPHAALKDTKVLGFDIPKGCMVIPNAYSAHMELKYWKDPENFRPERFLDADNNIIDSHRVISFSLGKRSCIGEILGRQSNFLFITSLVQRFDIRPPEGQKSIVVKEVCSITTAPSPFEVRLIPRVKATQG